MPAVPADPSCDDPGSSAVSEAAAWRVALAAYARPHLGRSALDLLTSAVAYLAVSAGMIAALRVSVWLTLALVPLSTACLLRTYIVFHDCAHGSFLPTSRANRWVGAICGLLVLTPYARWRHDHAIHHATSGDLDRRGIGDLPTLTVAEYAARSPRGRLAYRLFRHPVIMLGIGPVVAMIIGPRLVGRGTPSRIRRSVLLTDLAIALVAAALVWAFGIVAVAIVWTPPALLAGSVGIWLFYVQHQFEEAYWQRGDGWCYADAALRGSSFLKLPRVLQYATGNIGYHHVHHLSVRIPNYRLQRAHEATPAFASVPVLTIRDGVGALRLKLWDERAGRLVTFAQARASASAA
jgi:acyl-lipid omega-6 desaturase (Delta-12 desaturase)